MKDLWRMDNERGYWIREGERERERELYEL
jgi:hypothetical protein